MNGLDDVKFLYRDGYRRLRFDEFLQPEDQWFLRCAGKWRGIQEEDIRFDCTIAGNSMMFRRRIINIYTYLL
jgi:hypothetical protein